jgi:hypothetical protein
VHSQECVRRNDWHSYERAAVGGLQNFLILARRLHWP